MTILFIGPLPEPITGQSKACEVFLGELKKHYSVDVVNLKKDEFKQGVSSLSRIVAIAKILQSIWRKKGSARAIYLTISESFAGNLRDLLIYLLCLKKLDRMVVHLHGGFGLRSIMLGKWHPLRRLNEFFFERIGAVIVLGPTHVEIFRNVLPKNRVHIVPNFAEDSLFIEPENVYRKFKNIKSLRLLFLSNMLPGKGHEELLDAYLSLPELTQACLEIDFAGGFESEKQREAFLARINGMPRLCYHGVVRGDRKRQLFHQAHVFCLPTYYAYEGQPISILEAYASGCVVITTNHSGICDIFTGGANGYEVPKRSPSGLAAAIRDAVSKRECLLPIAAENLRAAQTNYRTVTYNSKLMAIINARLKETSGGSHS
jgi:glycosyltransferase involved in cell wall biosynthesis